MAQGSSPNDFRDHTGDILNGGNIKKVWLRVVRPGGQEARFLLYQEVARYDPFSGAIIEDKQIEHVVEVGGGAISAKEIAGFCSGCNAVCGRKSFVHCENCGVGLGDSCCAVQDPHESSDYYCKKCYRAVKIHRTLGQIGKFLLTPFVAWEE